MATDASVDVALREWAHWLRMGGKTGDGFPVKSVLHESWLPPSPGMIPGMKVARSDDRAQRAMHDAVGRLGIKLRNTLVVHYCYTLTVAEQAERLGCGISTVHSRVQAARRQIGVRRFF